MKRKPTLKHSQRIFVFIGPEGSGKTTQAKKLAEEFSLPYITTSGMLHDLADNDPGPLGEACRVMFAEHVYLDGKTFLDVCVSRFSQEDTRDGFVLDGGLRTLEETLGFPDVLIKSKLDMPLTVIYLQIPESVSYKRLVTGKNARKRKDDTKEAVAKRLSEFSNQLTKRLKAIEEYGWEILEVDADHKVNEVYDNFRKLLLQK